MSETLDININQSCAILIDGNNIEMSLQALVKKKNALVDFCYTVLDIPDDPNPKLES